MQDTSRHPRCVRSLRTRMLIIGLVPSLLLLLGGLGLGLYLVATARHEQQRSAALSTLAERCVDLITAMREERRLSERLVVAGAAAQLDQARRQVDDTARALLDAGEDVPSDSPGPAAAMDELRTEVASLSEVRRGVDRAPADVLSAAQAYDHLQDDAIGLLDAVARASNSPRATEERSSAEFLVRSADLLARSTSVVGATVGAGGLPADARTYYLEQSGAYDAELAEVASISPRLGEDELATFGALRDSAAAATLAQARTVLAEPQDPDAASGAAPLVDVAAYDEAAAEAVDSLHGLGADELIQGDAEDQKQAADQVRAAVLLATLLVVLAGVVLALAVVMVNRLVRRLARLRDDTLHRAEHDLPAAVARVRAGQGGLGEAPEARTGYDEIDEVAAAFDRAQHTALQAAAGEAAARSGFAAVYLNIAHRSQSIVHRQLKVLDEAERAETDPDQLARLFQLDHLATRERRNAENLIVLGGGTPGRQWREPVPLIELIRSAISETVQYNRIEHGRVPAVPVAGPAVADLVHLLAELLDNAAAFSPPETPIMVRGNLVGRGLVIEVEDQGLGIPSDRREQYNGMLADPPDFSVDTLRDDTRLGLFVVARLADRHGIRITLLESAYGGTRAVVLVPVDLLTVEDERSGAPAAGPAPAPAEVTVRPVTDAPSPVARTSPAATAPVTDADPAPATRSTARIRPTGEPAAALSVDPDRPVLPQRRRMDHLIPQLAVPAADGGTASDEPTGTGPGRPAAPTRAPAVPSRRWGRSSAAPGTPVGPTTAISGTTAGARSHHDRRRRRTIRAVAPGRPRRPDPGR